MKSIKEKLLHLHKLDEVLRVEELAGKKVAIFHDGVGVQDMLQLIAESENAQGNDEAFTIVNLTTCYNKYEEWCRKIPRIQSFYAIKCNNDPLIAKVLADAGCGFDCASDEEINQTLGKKLTTAENIIYANPVKQRSFIGYADKLGVRKMTFDNVEELDKIREMHNKPELVLRIRVDDPAAENNLGVKFGCDPPLENGKELLTAAQTMKLPVIGIAFHVGSRAHDPQSYCRGIMFARRLFDIGTQLGHQMRLLDIGGGYPGFDTEKISFDRMAQAINGALDEYFPAKDFGHVRMISEPGRFFASTAYSLMVNVIGATKVPASRITKNNEDKDKEGYMYYLNDGCHGSFNSIVYDHSHPHGQELLITKHSPEDSSKTYPQ
uniref:ornithine decarboxylase n=1 Tax=Ditylenchus dipsaci TaxID=166011 RepID=A0A915D3L9_9BILA